MLLFLLHSVQNSMAFHMIPNTLTFQHYLRLKHLNAIYGVVLISCHLFFILFIPPQLLKIRKKSLCEQNFEKKLGCELKEVVYDYAFKGVLEQLVSCFLKAPRGNIINSLKKGSYCQKNIVQLVSKKLLRYWYDCSNASEGVLEQFVNCFLEAIRRYLAYRHIHIISSKTSLWSMVYGLKGNLKDRLFKIFRV